MAITTAQLEAWKAEGLQVEEIELTAPADWEEQDAAQRDAWERDDFDAFMN